MPDPERVVVLTQTTLSVQDTQAILARLRERFPKLELPPTEDICYATTNRQAAVSELSNEADLVLVVGSKTSSNSNRLVETARARGRAAYLVQSPRRSIRPGWRASRRWRSAAVHRRPSTWCRRRLPAPRAWRPERRGAGDRGRGRLVPAAEGAAPGDPVRPTRAAGRTAIERPRQPAESEAAPRTDAPPSPTFPKIRKRRKGPYAADDCGGPPPEFLKGIHEFNAGEFFEQHETLELLWRATESDIRYLYQGVLLIGVGFYHQQQNNYHGTQAKLSAGHRDAGVVRRPARPWTWQT